MPEFLFFYLSLSRNPVCTQEQTGSRTYMSEKTAKRLVSILHGLRALVGCGKDSAIAEHFLADMRRFVCGIGHNGLYLWEIFRYFVVNFIKGHAVMDIAGCHDCFQHETVLVAGGMRLIGELSLMLALDE